MALDAATVFALAHAIHSPEGAAQIAAAVAVVDSPGVVDSHNGLLTLGTNTTDAIASKGLFLEPAADALTAFAGGGQASATQMTAQINRFTTVATAADSGKLPLAAPGLSIIVINSGAQSMQVFGKTTDTINDVATATGVAQGPGTVVRYSCTVLLKWYSTVVLAESLVNTVVTGTGTMVSGAMEGANSVILTASGQAGITLTTRTAAQIQANVLGWAIGKTYRLRIVNNNTGTLTTTGGANVTMTSTIPAGYYADYIVTFATATTITVAQVTVAPTNNGVAGAPVAGVAAGYKIARGVATTLSASDTVVSGLATVVAVVVSPQADLDVDLLGVTATIGNQAGAPAAGSFLLKSWKVTTGGAAGNPTPVAATTFTKAVNWIALGT